jgi:hypothetical protein
MMGTKARHFIPVPAISLDELVPDHRFYRHLDRTLDLSLVRDLVQDCYAACGRPSIDPVVFFKFQLVTFFDGVRSERLLLRLVADRLGDGKPADVGPSLTCAVSHSPAHDITGCQQGQIASSNTNSSSAVVEYGNGTIHSSSTRPER